ncbi:hypothetical protein [Blastococcus xanthinilyticus]|uniref:Uncharacterized protein n=1 Tax=Blastococcus xanthinilyticus TaxID=1564164 RepID=A0A5S5CVL3_9ACTN|nr:hypothetical protein [Blastococcus xanthinilyticus]TYP87134.1 hypothetical protein BD833_10771 [Blastococcus xanthinilyticus]
MSAPTRQKALPQRIRKSTAAPSMTVEKFRARLAELGGQEWPDEPLDHEGEVWRSSGPESHLPQFTDKHVEWVIAFIEKTGLPAFFNDKINAGKKKAGRPGRVSILGVLVALWLCAETGRGMLALHMRDVLFHQISPAMQDKIGIRADAVPSAPDKRLAYDLSSVACVSRRFRLMLSHIDPSPLPKNRRMAWEDLDRLKRDLAVDDMERLQASLDWVCNQMLEAAWRTLPRAVRRQYRGNACIDATPMKVGVRSYNATVCASDPDAGIYVRDGDHADPSDKDQPAVKGKAKRFQRKNSVRFFAYDVHLIVAADTRPGVKQHLPSVPLAMTVTRPGEDPAGSARRMFASAEQRNHPTGYLSGDALYSNQNEAEYQIPALAAGRKVVMTYTDAQLGNQGSHASGAHLIEGWYYCPSMPADLVNATVDYRADRIDHATWQQRITERQHYRMRRAEKVNARGYERYRCPAAGANPIAVCPFKERSENERATRQADQTTVDARIEIDPSNVPTDDNGVRPQVCRQETVSIHVTDDAKFRQSLQYGTEEHYSLYNLMRQSQEGEHGRAKDEAYQGLGSPSRRRMRGRAVQSLFAAFLLAAASVRKIDTFLKKAKEPDGPGGAIFVLKRSPGLRKNTWHPDLPDSPDPPELAPAA